MNNAPSMCITEQSAVEDVICSISLISHVRSLSGLLSQPQCTNKQGKHATMV
jgi:hypothetical protein